MNIKPLLSIIATLFCLSSVSQERLINCNIETNADKTYSIFADSRIFSTYTIRVSFSGLNGYDVSPYVSGANIGLVSVESGKREIYKLKKTGSGLAGSFSYRYQYYPGKSLSKAPDSSFAYLLPAAAGRSVRISKTSSLSERIGQKKEDDFFATGFVYQLGDTICAARAGIIFECNDNVKEGEARSLTYKSTRNRVRIEHQDGSIGAFDILAPIQLLVQPGDKVLPGTPLAIFNKESEKYIVLLSLYYLNEKKLMTDNTGVEPPPSSYSYLHAHFYSAESNSAVPVELDRKYVAAHPKEIIAAEMTKRERKKLGL